MFKTLTAAALSLTIALTGMTAATPAMADRDDVGRIIGGIAALAILGAAIGAANDNNNNRGHGVTVIQPGYGGYGYGGGGNVLRLPSQCRQDFHTDRGVRAFFGRNCTRNHVARPHLLPDNCLRQIHTNHGLRTYYAGPCMRRAGWTF